MFFFIKVPFFNLKVNQLRHDINLKDNLLKSFIDSESDSSQYTPNDSFVNKKSNKYEENFIILFFSINN